MPQVVDVSHDANVVFGDGQAVQLVHDGAEAGEGIVARLRLRDGPEAAVNVGLLAHVLLAPPLERRPVVLVRRRGRVEGSFGIVKLHKASDGVPRASGGSCGYLSLEQGVLVADAAEQVVERVQVGGGLQLVIEEVGQAGVAVGGHGGGGVERRRQSSRPQFGQREAPARPSTAAATWTIPAALILVNLIWLSHRSDRAN